MTAQGHPRAIFKRAIERGNVALAEATARELGRLSLDEALALTAPSPAMSRRSHGGRSAAVASDCGVWRLDRNSGAAEPDLR